MHKSTPALKQRWLSYAQSAPSWSTEQQAEFGGDLCRLFVTCGWSWNAVVNPEFKLFFEKYLPTAELPDRRILSGSILKTEVNKMIVATRQKIQGKLATYSEDGWKNIAHTHVDTSMLNVEGRPYLLRTHDMTRRPKTGDELFEIMKSSFEYAWNIYKVEIIAVCTDDGPDGKKARHLIFEWKPSIAVFECWAHQSSLMTGNYLVIKAPWMTDAKESLEVVKWFNGHGKALNLLRAQQTLVFLSILRLILPVVTCWTIHYCCLRRIKKVERAIRACVVTHGETLRLCAGNKPEQIAAAEHIIDTCNRNSFWKNIGRIVNHLEALAIASNILQSPNCRLDTVLLTLTNLFRIFNNLAAEDAIVKKTLHASLERRWGKTDQQLMILGQYEGTAATGRSGFVKLAIRILSILPNSADPEPLIDLTQEDRDNEEDNSDQDLPSTPSILSSQPTATQTVNNAASRVPAYKKIKLVDLFNYPTADAPAAAFEFFWQGGRDGLDAEEEALAGDDAGTAESSDAASTQAEAS
ncbi:ribonuclease H-like domain-containing protein [Mycena leptocephala]|nr:ribonuclease H-like domain-containing protein [Mycena leptocephala]